MNIDDLIGTLTKEIGDNAVGQSVTNFIDTGFPNLNKIISGRHDGGLPYGRIVEIFGSSSSGKCLTADTTLLTEHGMMTIEELYKHEGFLATCVNKSIPHHVGLINENNEIEHTSHLVWNGRKKVRRLVTKSGNELRATLNHPVRVMNKRGNIVWKLTKDIQVGDYLVTIRGSNQFGNGSLSEDEATLLGYLIADGKCNDPCRIQLSNTDVEIVEDFKRIVSSMVDKEIVDSVYSRGNSTHRELTVSSKSFRNELFEKYGLDYDKSATKTVPLCVRMANRIAVIAFLRAYFELECHIDSSFIEVTSASKQLLQQVKAMLLNLGIVSSLNLKKVQGYEQDYWRLYIGGNDRDRFITTIGFKTKERLAKAKLRNVVIDRTYSDGIPHINNDLYDLHDSLAETNRETLNKLTDINDKTTSLYVVKRCIEEFKKQSTHLNEPLLVKLQRLVDANYFYDIVEQVEELEPQPTFDVALPKTHSFWSNGIVSHNTAMATQWLVQTQKLGGIAIFIDWERSFDVNLAQSFGLNTERPYWIYAKPKTWEEGNILVAKACHIIRQSGVIPPEAPILAVFDSVASAIPKSMSDKEIDEYTMNDTTALARVASTTLKSMAQHAETYNATLLYLNQIRTKPGVAYGDPTSTTGGVAMEFYSTVRLQLSRKKLTEAKKGGKVFVGQTINIKCQKSKLTKPFQECSLDMVYDDMGVARFDALGSLLQYLIDTGKIVQSGARIVWGDKTYYRKDLLAKIEEEGGIDVLKKLLD